MGRQTAARCLQCGAVAVCPPCGCCTVPARASPRALRGALQQRLNSCRLRGLSGAGAARRYRCDGRAQQRQVLQVRAGPRPPAVLHAHCTNRLLWLQTEEWLMTGTPMAASSHTAPQPLPPPACSSTAAQSARLQRAAQAARCASCTWSWPRSSGQAAAGRESLFRIIASCCCVGQPWSSPIDMKGARRHQQRASPAPATAGRVRVRLCGEQLPASLQPALPGAPRATLPGCPRCPTRRSVRAFADEFLGTQLPLHGLICNAGVGLPRESHTQDGFEATVG